MGLKQEDIENELLIYLLQYEYSSSGYIFWHLQTNAVIHIFDIILCICVHIKHCFYNYSKT